MIAIPLILVGLEAIVVWVVAFGARQSWNAFAAGFTRLIHKPQSILRSIWNWTVIGQLTKAAEDALSHGEDALGKTAQGAEPTTAGFVVGTGAAIDYHSWTMRYLADGVLDAFNSVKAYAIPAGVKAGTATAREQSDAASKRARAAAQGAAAAEAGAVAGIRIGTRAKDVAKIAEHDALVAKNAIAVPAPGIRVKDRTQDKALAGNRSVIRWLRRHAAAIFAAVGAGVVLRVLVRHLPWFQCRNVGKTARAICRMNPSYLDDLLLGLTAIVGSISIVAFAKEVQSITGLFEDGLKFTVRELHNLEDVSERNREAFLAIYDPATG